MAILSTEAALKLIKAPKNSADIQRARDKRIRHKLHTEAETDPISSSQPIQNWLAWVSNILGNAATFARFNQLARPPFTTNELVEGIFSSFEKVFESQNSFEKFEFTTPEGEADFADYRKRIGDFSFWETQGMETFKNSIDNVLVVDLPRLEVDDQGAPIQPSDKPEPYYYLLDVDRLVDVDNVRLIGRDVATDKDFYYFKTEYLIFKEHARQDDKEIIFVYDDLSYRVFEKTGSSDPVLVSVFEHGLGFCPARSFWTTPLNSTSRFLKRGPITNSLSDLDWLLFFQIAERYLQLYAPFPIYAMYRDKCTHKITAENGAIIKSCVGGYMQTPGQRYIGPSAEREVCPVCAEAGKVGPGHIIFIKPPAEVGGTGADPDLMANPIKVIPAETQSLDYVRKTLTELKGEIRVNCVGRSIDTNDASAKNELQVESGFESSEAILIKTKRNFEIIQGFALDTIARLRYGAEYLGGVVNYGDQFLQKSEGQEMVEYKTAVENKMPVYDLKERRKDIYNARYRNDPMRKKRFEILENLEPFPDQTVGELVNLQKATPALVNDEDLIIKMFFNSFIDRFERERATVTAFGSAITFDKKIAGIREDLVKYAQEYKAKNAAQVTPPTQATATASTVPSNGLAVPA